MFNGLPTLETALLKVGSRGRKSTACHVVSASGQKNGFVTSGKGFALRARHGGPSTEPVGCRCTARATPSARAGRRMPTGGQTGHGALGGLPRAMNSQLRTGTKKASGVKLQCTGLRLNASKSESRLEATHAPVARLPTRSRGLWPPRARVMGVARSSDKSRVPP
ncbi:hypothetical protein V6N13_116644 [Hibiscus sabdariffa]